MNRINKFFLLACFALAMGCGEQSSGNAQPVSNSASAAIDVGSSPVKEEATDTQAAASDVASLASVSYTEGTHYERLTTPVATVDSSKIEVTEVFWYGCSHCYAFEPKLAAWSQGVADDVVVVKNPAMWDSQGVMENHARIYYTAKVLGVLDKITPAAFEALKQDHGALRTEDEIARLFTDNGVAREDFDRTFKSFGVTSSVRQAESRQRSYRIQGTPELIINGSYRVTAGMAGSHEAMLKVTDYLIDKIRQDKSGS